MWDDKEFNVISMHCKEKTRLGVDVTPVFKENQGCEDGGKNYQLWLHNPA